MLRPARFGLGNAALRCRRMVTRAEKEEDEEEDASADFDVSDSSSSFIRLQPNSINRGLGQKKPEDMAPKDQMIQALSAARRSQGGSGNSVTTVMGDEGDMEKWKELDEKVNEYPGWRSFKAIGTADDDFKRYVSLPSTLYPLPSTLCLSSLAPTRHCRMHSVLYMISYYSSLLLTSVRRSVVEKISCALGGESIHDEMVSVRASSGGKYWTVEVTALVKSPEDVVRVFEELKKEERIKWWM